MAAAEWRMAEQLAGRPEAALDLWTAQQQSDYVRSTAAVVKVVAAEVSQEHSSSA